MKSHLFVHVGIVLFGAGIYELVAGMVALVTWMLEGEWLPYLPQIALVSFWVTLPLAYFLWKRFASRRRK